MSSGSTAEIWFAELAARVRDGLHVVGVPTSRGVETLASRLSVPLTSLDADEQLDMTVDGADEVDPGTLGLLKGQGCALVRQKLVAGATRREVIIVDDGKLVATLGQHPPVSVAVVPVGWRLALRD
jgi:ribose 5-phosphate isomerase A